MCISLSDDPVWARLLKCKQKWKQDRSNKDQDDPMEQLCKQVALSLRDQDLKTAIKQNKNIQCLMKSNFINFVKGC